MPVEKELKQEVAAFLKWYFQGRRVVIYIF